MQLKWIKAIEMDNGKDRPRLAQLSCLQVDVWQQTSWRPRNVQRHTRATLDHYKPSFTVECIGMSKLETMGMGQRKIVGKPPTQ